MKNEEQIIELLPECLKGQDRIAAELKGTNHQPDQTVNRLDRLGIRADKIEGHLIILNLQTAENTRAIYKLADKVEEIAALPSRVTKLEKTVYK